MKTIVQNKKIYCIALIALLLFASDFSNAQDTGKKESDSKDKKKKVTRIVIYKDEDGKIIKTDTTITGNEFFDWENFSKSFDFNFDFDIPDLADLPEPPEPPEPPMPPDPYGHHFYYYHNGKKMTPEEKAELKKEMEIAKEQMEHAKEEMEKARDEMKKASKDDLKKQMDDLKKQMDDLKNQLD
jgi:hypothetical protein